MEFSISLAVLFKKLPDVIVNFSDDPLNDVERVYNRDCVGKILIHVRNILVVHVGNKIFYSSPLFHWKGGKVGFCDIRTSTAEQINWISGMKVLDYQSILTVIIHIQKHFIDRNGIGKREPVKLYISVKYIMCISI